MPKAENEAESTMKLNLGRFIKEPDKGSAAQEGTGANPDHGIIADTGAAPSAQTKGDRGTKTGVIAAFMRMSWTRVVGYGLYAAWMLFTFYNTFLLSGASDARATLYMNMLPSIGTLVLTLLVVPFAVRNADKRVLSKAWILGAGLLMAASTVLLLFADSATVPGTVITVTSALMSGVSSGLLFLGWCRLYTDVGPRQAMTEMPVSFVIAALIDIAFSHIPQIAAQLLAMCVAFAGAVLLRKSTFMRPRRPRPARNHHLRPRTRRMFTRGLTAAAAVGVVAGFLDVLAGFNYVTVPDSYESYLALGILLMAVPMFAIAVFARDAFVATARRVVLVFLVLGCLLTVFIERVPGLPEVIVFGAYQVGFSITLCTICIDVSNYFDQPATRAFGLAFGSMYLGEAIGNGFAHALYLGFGATAVDLSLATFVLSSLLVFVMTFLFTESDLVETSVGEMIDDEDEGESLSVQTQANETSTAAEVTGVDATDLSAASGIPQKRDIESIAAELSAEYGLTPRESEVLPYILRGRTLARIQEELHISQGTAGSHTRHIYQKLGVHNRQSLIDMLEERLRGE